MRGAVGAVAFAAALATACAQTAERGATGRGAQRAASVVEGQPGDAIEPEASIFEALDFGEELLVVLPSADEGAGAVILRSGDRELVVNKPYAAARVRPDGNVGSSTLDSSVVAAEFGQALAALPQRPAVFMLYFSEAKVRFTEGSLAKLESVFAELVRHPAAEISIIGHTDTAGSGSKNDKLSLARAKRARDELVRRGIPAGNIVSVAGRGERELLVPTPDDTPEPRNRRVEISVR